MKPTPPCVILGVTGGIAAYKAADLVSALTREGHDVHVVMTRNARQFVAPLTFQALSHHPVLTDPFEAGPGADIEHIRLAEEARCLCIAPATANILAKIAAGIADDMLTTLVTAVTCPVLVAPAMNTRMWEYPITRRNVRTLKAEGFRFVGPDRGPLACGATGVGRMAEPEAILDAIRKACRQEPSR
jgi:phosphopantothenoylcysteine decarboxylase/phosphopantothenate--cysteine ligase